MIQLTKCLITWKRKEEVMAIDIIPLSLIVLLVFIIISSIVSYRKERKSVKRLASEIQVRDMYRTSIYSDNPFEGTMYWDVEIIEIRNGWVSYKWADGKISYKEKVAFIEYPFKKLDKVSTYSEERK